MGADRQGRSAALGRWRLGTLKKLFLGTAALVAAVVVFAAVTLPPARLLLPAESDGAVPGIVHVHTIRSDGRGTPDEIAAAAARAGLKFVVFTDHGDATRTPDRPMYRSGVLCLDAVEISTTGGHYIAIDMPASPYPLGGEARDVVEDVKRLGGIGIVAHPDSPKPELRWREWVAPFDAIEVERLEDEPGSVVVAQLSIGGATFWVQQDADSSPQALGGKLPVRMILTVDDPDSVFAQAIAAGATEVAPITEGNGWRVGRIEDPSGHHWEIGKPLMS